MTPRDLRRRLGLESLEQRTPATAFGVLASVLGDTAQVGSFSQPMGVNYVDRALVNDPNGGSSSYDAGSIDPTSSAVTTETGHSALDTFLADSAPLPSGLSSTFFTSFDDPLPDPLAPPTDPPANPPASSPPAPSDPANTQAGNAGGSTSLVTSPPVASNPPLPDPFHLPPDPPHLPPDGGGGGPGHNPTLPTANADSYNVVGGSLTVPASGVLSNDTNPTGQPMSAQLVGAAVNGSVALSADGSFTYTAHAGFVGTDSFTYQAMADGLGSNTATVTLIVSASSNSLPTAIDDAYSASGPLTVAASGVLANDLNPSGLPLTAALVGHAAHGIVALNANGSFSYTPYFANFSGTDSFTYTAMAGGLTSNTATVALSITAPAQLVARDDAYTVAAGVLSVPASGVLGNDTNTTGQPMTASLVSDVTNGIVMLNSDGSFEYDASPGYLGSDSFSYQVTAGYQTSNVATVTLNVTGFAPPLTITNPGPQANAEGDTVSVQIQTSIPTNGTPTYAAIGLPTGLTIGQNSGLISGVVDYSDAEASGGHYSVTVSADDGSGQTASQTFAWTISNTNRPPLLAAPGIQNDKVGDAVSLQLVGSDPDADPLTYSVVGLPAGLSINQTTGLISGVLTAVPGSYSGTATVSDGSLSASTPITCMSRIYAES